MIFAKSYSSVVISDTFPIRIPLGSFSGISIFAGLGPKVTYDINPYGEVFCYFTSNFETAGINQTYHKLYLIIKLKIKTGEKL